MNANRWTEFIPQTCDLGLFTQQIKEFHHCVEITFRLIYAPLLSSIGPNVSYILFGQRINKVPLPVSHEIGASSV